MTTNRLAIWDLAKVLRNQMMTFKQQIANENVNVT